MFTQTGRTTPYEFTLTEGAGTNDGAVGGVLSSPEVRLNTVTGELTPAESNPSRRDVTLLPAKGWSQIPAGTYYLAVLPTTLTNGFWLSYVDINDKMHLRSYQKEYEVKPNYVTLIGETTNENSAVLFDDPNKALELINSNITQLTGLNFISSQHKPAGITQDYWYTLNDNVLTFFTTKDRYVINGDIIATFWIAGKLKSINFGDTSFPDTKQLTFVGAVNLESVTFGDNFDWSHINSLEAAFWTCKKLKNVDFGKGISNAKFTSMNGTFKWCYALESVDLSNADFSNVTSMSEMFEGCENLKTMDMSGWNLSSISDMSSMFSGCEGLESVNFGSALKSKALIYIVTP